MENFLDENGRARNKERYELVGYRKTAGASKTRSAAKAEDFSKGLFIIQNQPQKYDRHCPYFNKND